MKIAVLGSGMVGRAHGTKLVQIGHQVKMGSRTPDNKDAMEWKQKAGQNASYGTFAQAASFGEIIINCTKGMASLEALKMAGAENLKNKIVIDISNPLDFSKGMPPTLSVCNTDSLGEQIQAAFPETKVIKTLNTMNCDLQVNASLISGSHDAFISGNDPIAKNQVIGYLKDWYGWKSIIDLGDITTARGTEQLLPIWVRLMVAIGNPNFNFSIVKK